MNDDIKIKIEKMTEKDFPLLLKLGKDQWENDNWITLDYLKSSFNQAGLNYVAKSKSDVVGGVIFVYQDIVKNWIRYIIVDKKFRKHGIGRLLLEKVFKKMKSGESIFVDTGVSDKKAIVFYEKCGFKNCGLVRNLYGNTSAYFFRKTFK